MKNQPFIMAALTKLSRREREIMEIVYALREATLSEILDRIDSPPTRPALRSILGILENKGHLTHQKRGRQFVYQPTQAREQVGRSAFASILQTFFDGSLERAVASHFTDPNAKYSDEDIEELVAHLESLKRRP